MYVFLLTPSTVTNACKTPPEIKNFLHEHKNTLNLHFWISLIHPQLQEGEDNEFTYPNLIGGMRLVDLHLVAGAAGFMRSRGGRGHLRRLVRPFLRRAPGDTADEAEGGRTLEQVDRVRSSEKLKRAGCEVALSTS